MSDYQVFASRKAAQAEIARVAGWNARIVYIPWKDHSLATKRGNVIVIQCHYPGHHKDEWGYLREDGFIR